MLLFLHFYFSFFSCFLYFFVCFFLCFVYFSVLVLPHQPLAAAKLQSVVAGGGASSNSRLQRCLRRARSLQQRMQLQQQWCNSEAGKRQPEQQQEEQQLPEQPRYHLHSVSQSDPRQLQSFGVRCRSYCSSGEHNIYSHGQKESILFTVI